MKIAFVDFWDDFDPANNFLTEAFENLCDVTIVEPNEHPDILVYSIFGYGNLKYHDCIRLYYTGENDVPDFNLCDYAISFNHLNFGNRHFRLPFYINRPSFDMLRTDSRKPITDTDRDFASFVVSNNFCSSPLRNQIFHQLSAYRYVASGGRYANNVGGPVIDKLSFLNKYKFNIAFENSRVNGYTTEKIFDALAASTIPIYWGDPMIAKEVNPDCFINISDFDSLSDAIEYIKHVDNDPKLYYQILNAKPLIDNQFINWEENLRIFINSIISDPQKFVPKYGLGAQIHTSALTKEQMFHNQYLRGVFDAYCKLRKAIQKK